MTEEWRPRSVALAAVWLRNVSLDLPVLFGTVGSWMVLFSQVVLGCSQQEFMVCDTVFYDQGERRKCR